MKNKHIFIKQNRARYLDEKLFITKVNFLTNKVKINVKTKFLFTFTKNKVDGS